jgi:hypothetical protein
VDLVVVLAESTDDNGRDPQVLQLRGHRWWLRKGGGLSGEVAMYSTPRPARPGAGDGAGHGAPQVARKPANAHARRRHSFGDQPSVAVISSCIKLASCFHDSRLLNHWLKA